ETASPAGGVFESFPAVSMINANAQLAFVGVSNTGVKGVFRYDATSDTLSALMVSEDPIATPGGRKVCEFFSIGLADTGEVVVQGVTAPSAALCDDPTATARAVFYTSGGAIVEVAAVGDPSPITGTHYTAFGDGVFMNASGHIGFRASVAGNQNVVGLF